ncbi:class I SAM-dependent methyltransferase [Streptomyces boncukensis]|uniref:Class I SAM-dependent methyltransferase n=1 Tax=Streptomyces boncukensis TaxID=2711219 RepID=A0A6G4WZ73_9ACTN|nr:class I SAM-dependent methyltransferase [Streptomyces boncukensis]NGO70303.1 class I SAM-dependent methyltransferase [Streptomyces boncukensis]
MVFDHNDHYHRLLLRQLPPGCRTALDVGCGTGRFARRLAGRGLAVAGVDPSAEVIAEARAATGPQGEPEGAGGDAANPRFRQADVTRLALPAAHYDVISCLASLHHMPFATVAALRDALAPGGVLLVLGCYRERTPADYAWSLAAVPVNAAVRLAMAAVPPRRGRLRPPVAAPAMPLAEIRREAAALLPGCRVRRLLFWRYLLVYRARPADRVGSERAHRL